MVYVVTAVLAVAGFLFGSLTVEVCDSRLQFWFGSGSIRRSYEIADIANVETVRNPWYYCWGIHYTPHGWLYNISGYCAVELTLKSGN